MVLNDPAVGRKQSICNSRRQIIRLPFGGPTPRIGNQRPAGRCQVHVRNRASAENTKDLREFRKVRASNERARDSPVGLHNGHAKNDDHFLGLLVPVRLTD